MKVCIVVLDSLTGNTIIAAELIKRGILEHFHGDADVDILDIRTKDGTFDVETLAQAEFLGFGTPTICYNPTPNVLNWLTQTLPTECIARKSFFTFTTYGSHPGVCAYVLADALLHHNCGCQHLGVHEAFTPDTYMWFLPRKGEPQMRWSVSSVRSCKAFGARMAELYCTPDVPPFCQRPSFVAQVLAKLPPSAVKTMLGDVAVNPSLCVGCGACVKACPTGALCMRNDINRNNDININNINSINNSEEKKNVPVWNSEKCISCVHCVATCKRGALRVPTSESRLFYDAWGVDPDNIDTVDDATGQTGRMLLRYASTGMFSRPIASIRGVLMFVWALLAFFVSWIKMKFK